MEKSRNMTISAARTTVGNLSGREMNATMYFLEHALHCYNFLNRSFVYKHANGSVSVDHKKQTVTF
mgnify:CR=1